MEANQLARHRVGFLSTIAVGLIVLYQKVISPLKGFSCAHRYRHGGLSCSEYVKQVLIRKGFIAGYFDIRSRFRACRSAATTIQRGYPHSEAGFLDCGLDGCGDIGSCFDGGVAEGGGKSTVVIVLPFGLLVILLFLGGYVWFKAPLVSAIDIRLIENQQESKEEGVARLIGGENPDYQIVFLVKGKKITTNTLDNSTARNWLSLEPKQSFEFEHLDRITILNKQVLEDKVLEVIDNPERQGSGEIYEYRLTED